MVPVTEPPVLVRTNLDDFLETPLHTEVMCHTQQVERYVAVSASTVPFFRSYKRAVQSAMVKANEQKRARLDLEQ